MNQPAEKLGPVDFENFNRGKVKIRSVQFLGRDGWVQLSKVGGEASRWDMPVVGPNKSYAPTLDELLESRRARGEVIKRQSAERDRLKQALADAHGLLISYEKAADRFQDLAHDVELHFNAFRQDAALSDPIEVLARQLYEAEPKPPGPPDPPFGSPHFPKSEAERYRAMAREQLSKPEPSEPTP